MTVAASRSSYVAPWQVLRAEEEEAKTGLSIILVCVDGPGKGQTLSIPCLGANKLMGEREVSVARGLIDAGRAGTSAPTHEHVNQCLLQLEIPLEVNRRVALHAARCGCFVGLKTSPLGESSAAGLRTLLADGGVRLVVMQAFEVKLLQRLETVPADVYEADAAAASLLDEFPAVAMVVICLPGKAYVARYIAGDMAEAVRHSAHLLARVVVPVDDAAATAAHAPRRPASPAQRLLVLPARKLHYSYLDDRGGEEAPTPSGAADAFCAGLMVALGRGLSMRQALVWAYATGQLSAMQPSMQLEGNVEDIYELVRLELGSDSSAVGQLARPIASEAEEKVGPYHPDAFLRQTPLHMAVTSGRPSRLPKLRVPKLADGNRRDDGGLHPSELSRMLHIEDSLGFNPLQRANDMHQHSARDTTLLASMPPVCSHAMFMCVCVCACVCVCDFESRWMFRSQAGYCGAQALAEDDGLAACSARPALGDTEWGRCQSQQPAPHRVPPAWPVPRKLEAVGHELSRPTVE